MLNILPIQEKKKIITEYRLRLGVVSVFALVILILASLVLLTPSYLLAVSKYNSVSAALALRESKQDSSGQEKDIDTQVRDINKKINLFLSEPLGDRLSPPDAFLKIISMKSPAIKILGFFYDSTGRQERIVVTGVAADRDGLAQLAETLKKDKTFASVELPVSSYVKSNNIDFSIVLTRAPTATQ